MKLLHFTDIHLTTPGETIADRDPNANFRRGLRHAMDAHADAEALIITGDLSDWGDLADYELLKAEIGALPMPVHLCIGNHDDRANFLKVFPDAATDGFVQGAVPLSAGQAVLLDSHTPGTHAGGFCETRAEWLADTLAELTGPIYLFVHHNVVPTGLLALDTIMLLDAARLGGVIAPHRKKIAHLFHGHCHLPLSGSFHGVPFSSCRGTNHAAWADFGGDPGVLSGADLAEAYAVIQTGSSSTMVTMVEFGFDGLIRREGSPDKSTWDRATMAR